MVTGYSSLRVTQCVKDQMESKLVYFLKVVGVEHFTGFFPQNPQSKFLLFKLHTILVYSLQFSIALFVACMYKSEFPLTYPQFRPWFIEYDHRIVTLIWPFIVNRSYGVIRVPIIDHSYFDLIKIIQFFFQWLLASVFNIKFSYPGLPQFKFAGFSQILTNNQMYRVWTSSLDAFLGFCIL